MTLSVCVPIGRPHVCEHMTDQKPAVFVVDDDAFVRRALLRLIRSAGYEAEGFESAAAYLEHAPVAPPACLVLDLRMPGMNGFELQQRVNGTPLELPVVFITGYGDEKVRRQGLELGAVAVLFKPFKEMLLLEAIARALAGGPGP